MNGIVRFVLTVSMTIFCFSQSQGSTTEDIKSHQDKENLIKLIEFLHKEIENGKTTDEILEKLGSNRLLDAEDIEEEDSLDNLQIVYFVGGVLAIWMVINSLINWYVAKKASSIERRVDRLEDRFERLWNVTLENLGGMRRRQEFPYTYWNR